MSTWTEKMRESARNDISRTHANFARRTNASKIPHHTLSHLLTVHGVVMGSEVNVCLSLRHVI